MMEVILHTDHLSKSFPGVQAVDQVSFELAGGEILALVGENGAGKSTLTRMLGGTQMPDSGRIYLRGNPVSFSNASDALHAGISMVYQELSLIGGLSVAENIFANRQPVGRWNNIQWRKLHQRTAALLDRFNLDLAPTVKVKRLSMGQQQILEILKAISTDPNILILDEPTSSLTESESDDLFLYLRKLQQDGMSFIYITHKLSEVFEVADRVMVMRDGRYVDTRWVDEVSEQDLVGMMVGREIKDMYGAAPSSITGTAYFKISGFERKGVFQDVSLELKRGEILGLAGLVGAGRTELARSIFGVDPKDQGEITLDGTPIIIDRASDAIRNGIAYLTEDRKGLGLFLGMDVIENLIAPVLRRFSSRLGFLHRGEMAQNAEKQIEVFDITTTSINQKVLKLSGGNQQKLMVAMWMGILPRVVIFDEPTRGVDVGARSEIYHKLRELTQEGTGVIIISSDLPELIGICDRILVMHEGEITGELSRDEFSEELIMAYAAGIRNHHRL
jgi:ribose transport system ATP-binding protein